MPEEPAVGAATIRPMEALFSNTAMAYVTARLNVPPQMLFPSAWWRERSCASPPMRPPMDFLGVSTGSKAEDFMIFHVWRI